MNRTAIWIPAVIIGVLFLPIAATTESFGSDWTLHLWAIRQQQWNIEAMGHPGLFLSVKPLGAFYPVFAFVGSGIYSVGGYLALLLGPIFAYKLLYLVGLCLAYGGFTWLSTQVGLRGWRSQVPGAVLVTGAYFITDMVGRGDFGEFIAIASIPFLLASICAVLKSSKVQLRHRLAVVAAVFVFTGSHNITLLYGSVFVVALGLIVVLTWGPTCWRRVPLGRVGQLATLGLIGAGLNAWYLLPDLAYGLDTVVGVVSKTTRPEPIFVHAALLLNPLRPSDQTPSIFSLFARDIRLSLPCLFLAWAGVVMVVSWRGSDKESRRFFLAVAGLAALCVVFLDSRAPWAWVPRVFWSIQFTWRLDSYVLLSTSLLVMIALIWHARAPDAVQKGASVVLAAIVAFSVGAASWQILRVRSQYVTGGTEVPTGRHFLDTVVAARYVEAPSWYSGGDFRDVSAPVVRVASGRSMTVPVADVHGSSFSGTLAAPDGYAPFSTNIAAGPRFLRMTGIKAVGRTQDGFVVAVRPSGSAATGPVDMTIRQTNSGPVRSGEIVSLLSALALLAVLVWPLRKMAARALRRSQNVSVRPQ